MTGLSIEAREGGSVLRVRAAPGASRARLVGVLGDALKVAVTEAPERGRANKAILEALREALDVPKQALTLIAGETSRDKRVAVAGIEPDELHARLRQLLEGGDPA